jgi:hypothetical protein
MFVGDQMNPLAAHSPPASPTSTRPGSGRSPRASASSGQQPNDTFIEKLEEEARARRLAANRAAPAGSEVTVAPRPLVAEGDGNLILSRRRTPSSEGMKFGARQRRGRFRSPLAGGSGA